MQVFGILHNNFTTNCREHRIETAAILHFTATTLTDTFHIISSVLCKSNKTLGQWSRYTNRTKHVTYVFQNIHITTATSNATCPSFLQLLRSRPALRAD